MPANVNMTDNFNKFYDAYSWQFEEFSPKNKIDNKHKLGHNHAKYIDKGENN